MKRIIQEAGNLNVVVFNGRLLFVRRDVGAVLLDVEIPNEPTLGAAVKGALDEFFARSAAEAENESPERPTVAEAATSEPVEQVAESKPAPTETPKPKKRGGRRKKAPEPAPVETPEPVAEPTPEPGADEGETAIALADEADVETDGDAIDE